MSFEILNFDERRNIIIPGTMDETIHFATEQFLELGRQAIKDHNFFAVALSGGQTPHAIYNLLSQPKYLHKIDWTKVICFWSDERSVPPDNSESNYFNAMKAGLSALPLQPDHIIRMFAEHDIEENALAYEGQIRLILPSLSFDLVMLGMGEDGHTASLFPETHALHCNNRLVVANFVPQKKTWRMTLTYDCINAAKNINIYTLGKNKAEMVSQVLNGKYTPDHLPVQKVGTASHIALWIMDTAAAEKLGERP